MTALITCNSFYLRSTLPDLQKICKGSALLISTPEDRVKIEMSADISVLEFLLDIGIISKY